MESVWVGLATMGSGIVKSTGLWQGNVRPFRVERPSAVLGEGGYAAVVEIYNVANSLGAPMPPRVLTSAKTDSDQTAIDAAAADSTRDWENKNAGDLALKLAQELNIPAAGPAAALEALKAQGLVPPGVSETTIISSAVAQAITTALIAAGRSPFDAVGVIAFSAAATGGNVRAPVRGAIEAVVLAGESDLDIVAAAAAEAVSRGAQAAGVDTAAAAQEASEGITQAADQQGVTIVQQAVAQESTTTTTDTADNAAVAAAVPNAAASEPATSSDTVDNVAVAVAVTTTTTETTATIEATWTSSALSELSELGLPLALVKLMANPPAMITEAAAANAAIAAAIERGGTFSQIISLMAAKVAPTQVDLAKLVVILGADDEQIQSLVSTNPGLIQAIGSLRGLGD